jgi:hypothetical protein
VRYRDFVLIPQADLTWLIRPERSPMPLLPFQGPANSVSDVKALVDSGPWGPMASSTQQGGHKP